MKTKTKKKKVPDSPFPTQQFIKSVEYCLQFSQKEGKLKLAMNLFLGGA